MACVVTKTDHRLTVISRRDSGGPGISMVVRWCEDCGAVVIDVDVDGRRQAGDVMPMRFPALAYKAAQHPELLKDKST